jgi:hypothetical protein
MGQIEQHQFYLWECQKFGKHLLYEGPNQGGPSQIPKVSLVMK